MRLWVVAMTGMLGSAIYDFMKSKKIDVIGTTKEEVDITSENAVLEFVKDKNITHIVNCAAYTKVDKAEEEKELAYLVNAKGIANLGKVAKEISAKVIHFSTDYVFDGKKNDPYVEEDNCIPCNVYGETKWQGECLLRETNADVCIIRTSWLFGLNGNNFVSNMLNLMREKEEISVVDDQFGRPTFCIDLARAVFSLLSFNGTFHFANSNSVSWFSFTQGIFNKAKELGFTLQCKKIIPIKAFQYHVLAKRPTNSILNTNKYESVIKEKPRSWEESLSEYMKEYFKSLWQ